MTNAEYTAIRDKVIACLHGDYWKNDMLEIVSETDPRIVRLFDGRVAVMVFKRTHQDITRDSKFWLDTYADFMERGIHIMDARAKDYPVETVLYDVTMWPGLRPYKATPAESRKYTKEGKLYANQREENETPEEYGRRVYDTIIDDPQRFFQREEVIYLPDRDRM